MISPYEFSALSRQILMSVQPKPVRVMSTLTAQTVKVLTTVLVNRDLLEMGQYVKVNQDNQLIRNLFFSFINLGGKTLLAKFFKYSNLIMKFYKKIRFPSKVDQKTDLEELDSPKMNSGVSILGELVFFPQQMLTSVQPNLLRAIQTLIAPIVTALLAVLVNRDSLVMEEFVKVRMDIILITSMLRT